MISSQTKIRDLDEYQAYAARTINGNLNDSDMLLHAVFGLCSEAGEVAGIKQKVYQGHYQNDEHLKKELGDCMWMIAEACTALHINMSEIATLNIQKLRERYPKGFEAERSLFREAWDI